MNKKYLEPTKVEKDIRLLVQDALRYPKTILEMINTGKVSINLKQGMYVDTYGSGFVDIIPVMYKKNICYRVDFSLYDYRDYDIAYPYASGVTGAYLYDKEGNMLAIAENESVAIDNHNFPWTTASKKCSDPFISRKIIAPHNYIVNACEPLILKKQKTGHTNPIQMIKDILNKNKSKSAIAVSDVERFATNYKLNPRSMKTIDKDIQDNIDAMETFIEYILNGNPIPSNTLDGNGKAE